MKNTDSERTLQYACSPRIELIGNEECFVEGLKRIEEYSEGKIKIGLGRLSVTFLGDGLFINSFSEEGATVEGTIMKMEFSDNA